jgi:hypothetical protein
MEQPHSPEEAARAVPWRGPAKPGGGTPIERTFRDGHTETWWAADLSLGGYGPDRRVRLIVATSSWRSTGGPPSLRAGALGR